MEAAKPLKLIHIASIQVNGRGKCYLFLREKDPQHFVWFDGKQETEVSGITVEEALRLARKRWKADEFRTVMCGFRYTLPERDEHGLNALFCQMKESYASPNGVYFDTELGHNCFVNFASQEARDLCKQLAAE